MSVKRKRKAGPRVKAKETTPGRRVGTKRSDMRWQDEHGNVWASRFEYEVFRGISKSGLEVRRCVSGSDTFDYESPVKQARCRACDGRDVVTDRTYTPDFLLRREKWPAADGGSYYLEAKGYLRAEKRRLLRDFRKARPDLDLRLVVERDYKATSSMTILQWAERYLKVPAVVWTGKLPKEWT